MTIKPIKGKIMAACAALICSSFFCGNISAAPKEDKAPSDFEYEFRLGWGGYPFVDAVSVYGYFGKADCDIFIYDRYELSDIYKDYQGPGYLTGVVSAEFDMNFKKWFTLTIGAGVCGAYQNIYDSVTNEKVATSSGAVISILPEARFNWLNRKIVRMYSAIGAGLTVSLFDDKQYDDFDTNIYPAFQFTPVGISIGRKVYGFAEVGVGTQFMGAMAGIGVRF